MGVVGVSVTDVGRTRLAIVAVTVLVVAAGIGAVLTGMADLGRTEPQPLRGVPAEADAVAYVDADAGPFRNATIRNVTLGAFDYQSSHPFYRGPRLDRWPRAFVAADETPVGDFRSAAAYVDTDGTSRNASYRATIVRANWSTAAVVAVVERETNRTLVMERRQGTRVFVPSRPGGPTVAVLQDGGHVIGTEPAVTDAISVADGEAPAVSGRLRTRFDEAREGYVTFVYPFPAGAVPDPIGNATAFRRAETLSGTYYRNETTAGMALGTELVVHTQDEAAARDVAAVVRAALELYRASSDDQVLGRAAGQVATDHTGDRAVIVYEDSAGEVGRLVDRLA